MERLKETKETRETGEIAINKMEIYTYTCTL